MASYWCIILKCCFFRPQRSDSVHLKEQPCYFRQSSYNSRHCRDIWVMHRHNISYLLTVHSFDEIWVWKGTVMRCFLQLILWRLRLQSQRLSWLLLGKNSTQHVWKLPMRRIIFIFRILFSSWNTTLEFLRQLWPWHFIFAESWINIFVR